MTFVLNGPLPFSNVHPIYSCRTKLPLPLPIVCDQLPDLAHEIHFACPSSQQPRICWSCFHLSHKARSYDVAPILFRRS